MLSCVLHGPIHGIWVFSAAFIHQQAIGNFLLLALLVTALIPTPCLAQHEPEFYDRPYAPEQWNVGRRFDESQLRYCVDKRDPDWQVASAIAEAIAQSLLLEAKLYLVERDIVMEDITKVYESLLKYCDLHMGFKLIPDGYGTWGILSRSYYTSQYVFVTSEPNLDSLANLDPSKKISVNMGTMAHLRLISYLKALPINKRWPTYPMGSNELALVSLTNGTSDVALVWAPILWSKQQEEDAYKQVRPILSDPLPTTSLQVGALMLSNQTFLRTAVDEAITALIKDGTISEILNRFGFPATAEL